MALFTEVLKLDDPAMDEQTACENVETDLRRFNPEDARKVVNMRRRFSDSLNRLFGIVSLSAAPDDILMWSHYADAHRGYCVGLNVEALESWIDSLRNRGMEIRLVRVQYNKAMPVLHPLEHNRSEMI